MATTIAQHPINILRNLIAFRQRKKLTSPCPIPPDQSNNETYDTINKQSVRNEVESSFFVRQQYGLQCNEYTHYECKNPRQDHFPHRLKATNSEMTRILIPHRFNFRKRERPVYHLHADRLKPSSS